MRKIGVFFACVVMVVCIGIVVSNSQKLFIDSYDCVITDPEKQCYDGDTIRDVRVLLLEDNFEEMDYGEYWPGVHITERGLEVEIDIRIAGIDTPERRVSTRNLDGTLRSEISRGRERAAAMASRKALINILLANNNHFSISDPILGKYAGRIVADVFVDEVDVATTLIEQGHAKPYDGGTKPFWNWGD